MPLFVIPRLLPVKVPSSLSLMLPNCNIPSGINVSLCFQSHFKLLPMAPHGSIRALGLLNFTCSGLIKSWFKKFVICGGGGFGDCWPEKQIFFLKLCFHLSRKSQMMDHFEHCFLTLPDTCIPDTVIALDTTEGTFVNYWRWHKMENTGVQLNLY